MRDRPGAISTIGGALLHVEFPHGILLSSVSSKIGSQRLNIQFCLHTQNENQKFCRCVCLFSFVGHYEGMNKKNDQAYKLLVRVLKKVVFRFSG